MKNEKENSDSEAALDGLRIIDISDQVSGMYCTKLMALFGAEVIRIDKPGIKASQDTEMKKTENLACIDSIAPYLYYNTGKKSLTLDIGEPLGREILKKLIKGADILVETFHPGAMKELGLDYDTLESINPKFVMVSITDFGQTGPYSRFKGGRLVTNALGGHMYYNGDPDREPLALPGQQTLNQGGMYGLAGALSALMWREKSGRGQHVDISIMECMVSIIQYAINRYEYSKMIQKRMGNRYAWSHPIAIYPCKDGAVAVTASMEDQAERLIYMIEMPHLLEDQRFVTGFHRLENADAFDEHVIPWFLKRTADEIVELCQEWRIPAADVRDIKAILEDEHLKERGFWKEIDHPKTGILPYAFAPFRMSETPANIRRSPLLGEHNSEILSTYAELSQNEITILEKSGIL